MKKQEEEKNILIRNLSKGHHIFGPVHMHVVDEDGMKSFKCIYASTDLPPGGKCEMSEKQFAFYADSEMERRVNDREFAVHVNGKDLRPELARKEGPAPASVAPASESAAHAESSILAEILAQGEPRGE